MNEDLEKISEFDGDDYGNFQRLNERFSAFFETALRNLFLNKL